MVADIAAADGSAEMAVLDVLDEGAFLASDRAGDVTGTIVNVTCGLVPG